MGSVVSIANLLLIEYKEIRVLPFVNEWLCMLFIGPVAGTIAGALRSARRGRNVGVVRWREGAFADGAVLWFVLVAVNTLVAFGMFAAMMGR